MKHLIDFQLKVNDIQKPYCNKLGTKQRKWLYDIVPSLNDISKLAYFAEDGLTNILKILGGETQPVDVIGTKIAVALRQVSEDVVI